MKPRKRMHTSISGKTLFGTDAEYHLASALPYARWICADGREILVNAFGEPMWERLPRGEATPADPYERPSDVMWIERIYGDAFRHHEKRHAAKHWLVNFRDGTPAPLYPETRERVDRVDAVKAPGGGGEPAQNRYRKHWRFA